MEQERYNLFNLIHKGLRHALYDVALKIQRTDFGSASESFEAISRLEVLIDYFEGHADAEDTFILPAIQRYDPLLVDDFEKQHVEDHRLGFLLTDIIQRIKIEESITRRIHLGQDLLYAYQEFIAFNLYHMNKEEDVLNKVLWENFTSLELQAITQQIIQSIKPQKLMALNRWMMRSINISEVTGWLTAIQRNAPETIFTMYFQLAEEELIPSQFAELKHRLGLSVDISL